MAPATVRRELREVHPTAQSPRGGDPALAGAHSLLVWSPLLIGSDRLTWEVQAR